MGYRDQLKSLVNQAITSMIGDLSSSATFQQITYGEYDADIGKPIKVVSEFTCRCLLTSLKQTDLIIDLADHERNLNGIANTAMKLLVPTAQLPDVDVDALTDEVVVDGVSYNVFSSAMDPSGSLYTFIIRAIGGKPKFNGV